MASIKLIKSISQVTIFKYANEVAAFKHLVRFFFMGNIRFYRYLRKKYATELLDYTGLLHLRC
jgi:hypothetical protein